ncbi:hypothetical protein A11A3_12153 [Alcanivorax hongdengensis A-11-3]|uniref:Uncharacterized protein n=1 Tax=Alcanivorax hongdengensis A-11-3 TaxID=1177179 RepID=L0WD72_9GAMM|nr:hypothetical protein [Alcanivorax hongdengensis]EKF73715.1 hypothetical protein A11A3_12153 [Alcanivorax hongdengensis A-11-3]
MMATDLFTPSLDSLPRVFSLADLKQQMPARPEQAMELVLRWLESGVVRQVAPPRPVFIRTSIGEVQDDELRCQALLRAFPSLVMVGGSVLWRQGISNQRDAWLECCVAEQERDCNLTDVRLHWRPPAWWEAIRRAGGIAGEHCGVAMLSGEMAVADATVFTDVWMPDREQIDWQRLSTARLSQASEELRKLR